MRFIKTIIISVVVLVGATISVYLYLHQEHRDVQQTQSDYTLTVSEFVQEYLDNPKAANIKYLNSSGESKILTIQGIVKQHTPGTDHSIIILQSPSDKAGVQAILKTPHQTQEEGDTITIKGVLRAGPSYDDDLEMYENGYVEKASIIE
ncbi:OB-fold putative lipoprotein [Cyclobacteriaceae bacterium]|nr:OB-fold putative lipoprotein [Cyclobacteriaceae bacterium]